MEVNYGLPTYLIFAYFLAPFKTWEILIFTFSYLLILIVELVNTAFEKMLDRVHPEDHEIIGRSKDISAAAVFVAFLFALLVVVALVSSRFQDGATPIPFELPYA